MRALRIVHSDRPAGRRLRRRIALRLATVLDTRVERTARRIVAAIRRGGDAALLDAARAHDGCAAASTMADLRLAPLPGTAAGGMSRRRSRTRSSWRSRTSGTSIARSSGPQATVSASSAPG